jgi:hypothetical protein
MTLPATLPTPPATWTANNPPLLTASDYGKLPSLGGTGLHPLAVGGGINIPELGYVTNCTYPDETLGITGKNLGLATLAIWGEGKTLETTALRTNTTDKMQCVSTLEIPYATYTQRMRRSVNILWAKNANGWSYPYRINRPEIVTPLPSTKPLDSNRQVRLFGKNLSINSRLTVVFAQRNSEKPVRVNVLYAKEYEVCCELPANYGEGTWKFWVHNGTGGQDYGWSDPISVIIIAPLVYKDDVFNVDDMAGANVSLKFEAAMLAAYTNGGGIVRFGPGTYSLSVNTWRFPAHDANSPPVIMEGAGKDVTIINSDSSTELPMRLAARGTIIRNLSSVHVLWSFGNRYQRIENCNLSADQTPFNAYGEYFTNTHTRGGINELNITVENCLIYSTNNCASTYEASNIHFKNCKFYAAYYNGVITNGTNDPNANNLTNHGITFYGSVENVVEDCYFQSHDPVNGKIMTRAIATWWNCESRNVIINNTMRWVGAFNTSPAVNRNDNTGECILFHGQVGGLKGTVDSATSGNVTLNLPYASITDAALGNYITGVVAKKLVHICFASGRLAGQTFVVQSITDPGSSKSTITVSGFELQPEAGDIAIVRCIHKGNIICNNDIDFAPNPSGFVMTHNRVGISMYMNAVDNFISGNTIRHAQQGIHIGAHVAQGDCTISIGNVTRDNYIYDLIQDLHTVYVDAYSAIYVNQLSGGWDPDNQNMYQSIGNTFRNNTGSDSEAGVLVGRTHHDLRYYPGGSNTLWTEGASKGVLHAIIENNNLSNITGKTGTVQTHAPGDGSNTPITVNHTNFAFGLSISSNYTLIRNNTVDMSPAIDTYEPSKVLNTLHIVDDVAL